MVCLNYVTYEVCIYGSFSDRFISSFSVGTIFMIWRGSGRKEPSHNLSFSVLVFAGSNRIPADSSIRTHCPSVETRIGDLYNRRRDSHLELSSSVMGRGGEMAC